MTQRPFTLTPSQLRSALAGRLEQVRRPVEPQPTGHDLEVFESAYGWESDIHGKFYGLVSGDMGYDETSYRCPWGVVGDRLYVQEEYCVTFDSDGDETEPVYYKATHANPDEIKYSFASDRTLECWESAGVSGWLDSSEMPEWASRLAFDITGIRVERDDAGVWQWVLDVRKVGE